MQSIQNIGKTFLILSMSLITALFVQIHTTYAATYWSGYVTLSGSKSFQTQNFKIWANKVCYKNTKWATKTVSYKVQLYRSSDNKLVGTVYGNAYTFKVSSECTIWSIPTVGGNYYLKFTNETPSSTLYLNPYSLTSA